MRCAEWRERNAECGMGWMCRGKSVSPISAGI